MTSDQWGAANHHMLPKCPIVRSVGLDVQNGKAFVWLPGMKPFFVADPDELVLQCPESYRMYADRVDQNVPIFIPNSDPLIADIAPVPIHPKRAEHRLAHYPKSARCDVCSQAQNVSDVTVMNLQSCRRQFLLVPHLLPTVTLSTSHPHQARSLSHLLFVTHSLA